MCVELAKQPKAFLEGSVETNAVTPVDLTSRAPPLNTPPRITTLTDGFTTQLFV